MAQISNTDSTRSRNNNAIFANFRSTIGWLKNRDSDTDLIRRLSPLEPATRHRGVRTTRFEGVGGWFLETKEFREWRSGEGGDDKAVLFCSGNPGVGKTYLT